MSTSTLLERLREEVLVGDGALGTLIYARGVGWETSYDNLNLTRPELIRQIHVDYVAAGAQAIETNTFGANRLRLGQFGLEGRVREICLAGARLAREAAGDGVFVLGSVGPAAAPKGHPDRPELDDEELREIFAEPIVALAEGGVDAILLETFVDLSHLLLALEVAKDRTDLPVLCQMAFQERGHTYAGVAAAAAVEALEQHGADALGANCGRGVRAVTTAVETMTGLTELPVTAFANAGLPEYVDGRYIYLSTPQYMADSADRMAGLGANLIGGCCGTTPEHVAAITSRLRGRRPGPRRRAAARQPAVIEPVPSRQPPLPTVPPAMASFVDRSAERPAILVELDPPRGLKYEYLLRRARQLADMGVDAITAGDNPVAMLRMGNLAFAQRVQEESGLPCVVHLSCRDRNLLGTQSYLLAAELMGIHHVLALTGDPARVGDQPGATSVYDINSFGLIELIAKFNQGQNHAGMEIGRPTHFKIGVALNPHGRNFEARMQRLRRKYHCGAHFAMSQPVFDPEIVFRIKETVGDVPIPIYVGLFPVLSERNAEYLHHEVPGVELTEGVLRRMKGLSGKAGREMGLRLCREVVEATAEVVDGFYIVPPQGRTDTASALVAAIRECSARFAAPRR